MTPQPTALPRRHRGAFRLGAILGVIVLLAIAGAGVWWNSKPKRADVVEYPMIRSTDMPVAVAVGPDDTVWFSIDFSDAIGRLRGGKVERITKPGKNVDALGLAVDPQGNAWYADAPATAMLRVTPSGEIHGVPLATPIARLGRVATGADGSVWFAESTAYSVSSIRGGKLERHDIPSVRGGPFGVAVARDGTAWATLQSSNALMRIPPAGAPQEIEIPTRGVAPTDIAVAPDGGVWFIEFRANQVGRYADGKFTEIPMPEGIGALSGIAVTPDGSAWFGAMKGAAIGRVRNGEVTLFKLPREDAKPFTLATDSKGNLWYADIRGFVGRMTPR
ncbi:MAG: hypothetical protein U1F52_19755 [Burkholderiales bacterium]